MGKLISLSTMRELEHIYASVGQIVQYTGDMANSSGTGAVVNIRGGNYPTYDVALEDGREIRGSYLDGSRWVVTEQIATPELMQSLRAGVTAKAALDEANKKAAAESYAKATERVKAENPHLIQGGGHVIAAKNIRIELKRAFPGVKFSVRGKSFSGGDSIDISWTDGPQSLQVERITGKYQQGSFNGMIDLYEYEASPWRDVFGDSKYVHVHRDCSDEMVASVIGRVCRRLGGMDAIPTVEDYRQGRLYMFKQSGGCDVQREISIALSRHTYCIESRAS